MKKILILFILGFILVPIFMIVLIASASGNGSSNEDGELIVSTYGFVNPLSIINITSQFGEVRESINSEKHLGLDMSCTLGESIYSIGDGRVTDVYVDGYGGNIIVIELMNDRKKKVTTLYAHHSYSKVSEGDIVSRGEVIAKCGSTGLSTGPHVHLEIRVNGKHYDPEIFLPISHEEDEKD